MLKVTKEFVQNLPPGIYFQATGKEDLKGSAGDIVTMGDFTVDLTVVSKEHLIGLRRYVPREEYRLVKNRKIARLSRMRRKKVSGELQEAYSSLVKENSKLH